MLEVAASERRGLSTSKIGNHWRLQDFEGDASAAPWLNPTVAFDAEGVAELEEDAAATVGACEDV